MPDNNNKQEVPPGMVSTLDPQAGGLFQLSPEDETIVSEYARQKGVTQADAVRALLQHRPGQAQQPSVMERTLNVIDQAQRLGVASQDPNDVINSMGKGLVIKNLAKGLNDGDGSNKKTSSFDDIKEMMYLKIMGNMAGVGDNNQGSSSIVQEIKNENDKLRQELRESEAKRLQDQKDAETKRQADLEKLESKMRDMLFEKKIEKLEEKATAAQTSVSQEIKALSDKFELYKSIPQTAPVTDKHDAVTELEEIGGKLDRIKKALAPIFPQAVTPAVPGLPTPSSPPPALKNPDGSTDYLAAAERIGSIVVRGLEAFNKKAPATTEAAQAGQQAAQQNYTERRMGLDEYADYLLSLKERTPEQQQWLATYQSHLEREQAKIKASVSDERQPRQIAEPLTEQPFKPPVEATVEETQPQDQEITEVAQPGEERTPENVSQDTSPVQQPVEVQQSTETDAVDKMRLAEAERAKLLHDIIKGV